MYVLVDDSSQRVTNFGTVSGFGSIWLSQDTLFELESRILKLRIYYDCWGEIKWNNTDTNHLEIYQQIIEQFLELPIFFNLITFTGKIYENLEDYNDGDRKTAEMKAIFMLILYNYQRYASNFCKDKSLNILFDKEIVSRGNYKEKLLENLKIGRTKVPISVCNSCHSHLLGGLQLADLLAGAGVTVTSITISKSKPEYSYTLESKKTAFLKYIINKVNLTPVYSGKPLSTVKSNNWFYRPGL